jgi:hypothetical protein
VTAYVFGFGSLALRDGIPCRLRGHRREWGVAMDNRRTIPGYKFYVDPATGERPAVFVAFLDIRPDPDREVNGVAFPVAGDALEALDERERSYERIDVSALVELDGRVWAYRGRAAARERLAAGRRAGTAVVARLYLEQIRAGFAAYGALEEFDRTTDDRRPPLRDLRRIDVPAASRLDVRPHDDRDGMYGLELQEEDHDGEAQP